jgi:hypothetical protein
MKTHCRKMHPCPKKAISGFRVSPQSSQPIEFMGLRGGSNVAPLIFGTGKFFAVELC